MGKLDLGYFLGYNAKPVKISNLEIDTRQIPMSGSIYTNGENGKGINASATISTQVARVLALIAGCEFRDTDIKFNFRYNEEHSVSNVEIIRDGDTSIEVAQYTAQNGLVRASEYDISSGTPLEQPMRLSRGMRRGTAMLMAFMPEIIKDTEAQSCYEDAIKLLKTLATSPIGLSTRQEEDLLTALATLSDNIYFRFKNGDLRIDINEKDEAAILLLNEKVSVSDVEFEAGNKEWQIFDAKSAESKKKTKRAKIKKFAGEYILSKERKLTPTEEKLVPSIPAWYVVPTVATKIATAIQKSTGMNRVIRNIMLKGPAGTGKTEISKAIAAAHNLPYTHITCSAGMELIDLLGTFVPQPDGTFIFQESELLKAVKNGWVCEVQEPTVIIQPGVLPGLNSILEGGSITLLNGEVIERHPDSVIIFTTNVDYEGCRSMNESVEDRFPLKFYVELPEDDEMIARVKKVTNFKGDDVYIRAALSCLKETQEYLESNGAPTGKVGARVLYDWIDACQIFEDMVEAAEYTIVQSASDDLEYQDYIKHNIIMNVNWKNLTKTA